MVTKHEQKAINCIENGKLQLAIAYLRLQIEIDIDQGPPPGFVRDVRAVEPAYGVCGICGRPVVPVGLPPVDGEQQYAHVHGWAPQDGHQAVRRFEQGDPVVDPGAAAYLRLVRDVPVSHAPTTCVHRAQPGVDAEGVCGEVIRWRDAGDLVSRAGWYHVSDQYLGNSLHPATPGPVVAPLKP